MKNTKQLSTMWLDFINYIFLPFYILSNSIELIKVITDSKNILSIIWIIVNVCYSVLVLYFTFKKKKELYYLLYPFFIVSYISIVLFFSNKYGLTNTWYIMEFIFVGIIVCILPNYVYLWKRREIFMRDSGAHIKKCPGCNRIIPVDFVSCGKCDYKE